MSADLIVYGISPALLIAGSTAVVRLNGWSSNPSDYLVTAWRGFCATFQNGGHRG